MSTKLPSRAPGPSKIDLSIIIGAYQEAKYIGATLDQLSRYLMEHPLGEVEVLVVTANSTDGTARLVRDRQAKFHRLKLIEPGRRVGKGRDIKLGMLAASGHHRLFMDADLATPLHHLEAVRMAIKDDVPVLVAVRELGLIHHDFLRRFISGAGNLLARIVLIPGIRDTQCGFKLFRADVAEAVFSRQTIMGWGFDMEVLALARAMGYRIDCLNVPDWHDPKQDTAGLVGDSTINAALQSLLDLWRVRLRLWWGSYKL